MPATAFDLLIATAVFAWMRAYLLLSQACCQSLGPLAQLPLTYHMNTHMNCKTGCSNMQTAVFTVIEVCWCHCTAFGMVRQEGSRHVDCMWQPLFGLAESWQSVFHSAIYVLHAKCVLLKTHYMQLIQHEPASI